MNKQTTTRRAVMAAAIAMPTLVALVGSAEASADQGQWTELLAAYERANAAVLADDPFMIAAVARYEEACAAIPHVTTAASFNSMGGERLHFSTADPYQCTIAKNFLSRLVEHGPDLADYVATCREVVAAKEAREAEKMRLYQASGAASACKRNDRLDDARYKALEVLMAYPAPHGEALLWKLEYIFGDDASSDGASPSYSADWMDVIMSDARRILSTGRA